MSGKLLSLLMVLALFSSHACLLGAEAENGLPDVAIRTDNTAIAFMKEAEGYGLSYYMKEDGGWREIGNTTEPFAFNLVKNGSPAYLTGEIREIVSGDRFMVGRSSLPFDGGHISCEMNVSIDDDSAFRLDFDTTLHMNGEYKNKGGIGQKFSIKAPGSWQDVDYVLPGWWYKHNAHTEGGPGERAGHKWFVREDRLTSPSITMFQGDHSITLIRADLAKHDPEVGYSTLRGLTGYVTYDEQQGYTDLGSVGFEDMGNAQEIGICYPFYEGDHSYQKKIPLINLKQMRSSATALYDLKDGQRLEHSWWLRIGDERELQDTIRNVWKFSYSRYDPVMGEVAIGTKELKESLKNYYEKAYFDAGNIAGFISIWDTYRRLPGMPLLEAGFTGRSLLNAKQYLDYGRENNDETAISRSLKILDSWCSTGKKGFFNEMWLVSNWWTALHIPLHIGIPISQYMPFIIPTQVSTRRQAEALWALELAYESEKQRGNHHELWEKTIREHLDKLCAIQGPDGSFARTYDMDGGVKDPNPGATSTAVMALTKGYELLGDKAYLERAERSGDYIAQNVIIPIEYHGSTLDSNCEDKEAATYALYSMRCLYEADGDEKWLNCAEMAADVALTWFYLWDVPFDEATPLGRIGLKTTGFGSVSSENNHIDVYLFDTPSTLRWLGEKTGREEFEQMAELIYRSCLQVVPVEGDMKNCASVGFVPEIIQQTLWDYGFYGKGHYGELSCVGWTVASLWYATDTFVTGEDESDHALKT